MPDPISTIIQAADFLKKWDKSFKGKIPLTPNPFLKRNFKNIKEKQNYWNSLISNYGWGVKGHQNLLDRIHQKPAPVYTTNPDEKEWLFDKDVVEKARLAGIPIEENLYNLANQYNTLLDQTEQGNFDPKRPEYQKMDSLSQLIHKNPDYYFSREEAPDKTWYELFNSEDVNDPAMSMANMWIEGMAGQKPNVETDLTGFDEFGLDRFVEMIPQLRKKGFLKKNIEKRISPYKAQNEKGETVISARFKNYPDVISAQESVLGYSRMNAIDNAKKLNIPLDEDVIDFWTFVGFNYGQSGMRNMMKSYKEKGLLNSPDFWKNTSPPSYGRPFRLAQQRMQLKKMLENEAGMVREQKPLFLPQKPTEYGSDFGNSSVSLPQKLNW